MLVAFQKMFHCVLRLSASNRVQTTGPIQIKIGIGINIV